MDNLSTRPATGAQSSTQNPQTGPQAANLSGGSGDVQPGTPAGALNASATEEASAVPLQPQPLSSVQVGTVSQASTSPVGSNEGAPLGLSALSVLLFITAIVLFVSTFKSSKNTTD